MKLVILEDQTEDMKMLLNFLQKYMEQTGYVLNALPCITPQEIPEENSDFDAALLDIMMDGKPAGIDAARTLRAKDFRGPIAFLTTSPDYYAEGFEVGAVHYLVKPCTYKSFAEVMERLVHQAGHGGKWDYPWADSG